MTCDWLPSTFLIFSDNVYGQLVYYSHIPTIIISLLFGLYVFIKGTNKLLNISLSLVFISLAAWVFADSVLWATELNKLTMFFWSSQIILEPLVYLFLFYFIYVFIEGRDVSLIKKILFTIPIYPTFLLAATKLALIGFDHSNCDRAATEGPLVSYYGYALVIFYVVSMVIYCVVQFFERKKEDRKKIFLIFTGSLLFIFAFSWGNLIQSYTESWELGQYGLIGIPIFIAFLTYLIIKFKVFNIRLIGAQALVVGLVVLIGSKLFTVEAGANRTVTIVTLCAVCFFGYFLVKSVKKEIETRERIEALADELESANERLRVLDQQKSQFVSIASHQLRAPLTAIKGYLSMILEGDYGELTAPLKDTVTRVFDSANNLVTIVGDFLDVSRIEQGRMVYDWKDFDLKPLVETVTHELREPAEKKGLEFTIAVDESKTYMLHGDMNKLKQVFTNLVDNSIKYTPKGKVEILLSKPSADTIRFAVKDNGVGIDKETLPRLFEKFTRAENASEVNVIGTGLGLFVAKEMVKAHNGKVWAESAGKGLGSTFIVELAALK